MSLFPETNGIDLLNRGNSRPRSHSYQPRTSRHRLSCRRPSGQVYTPTAYLILSWRITNELMLIACICRRAVTDAGKVARDVDNARIGCALF
jgi:hypothetical protein